jgi:hypothetical protein
MAFESINVNGPEPAELIEPCVYFPERFRFQAVEAALCVDCGFHETSLAQNAQMLGHFRLWHAKLTLDFAYRLWGRDQQAQYGATVWLGNDFEGGFHSLYILQ